MLNVKAILSVSVILTCQVLARPQASSPSPEAAAAAAHSSNNGGSGNVTLIKSEITPLDGKGSFGYDIELSDGTKFMQSGHTEAPGMGETEPSLIIQGSYAYVAPDGKQISITYIADKNGFQPKGDAIPSQGSANSAHSGESASPSSSSSPAPEAKAADSLPAAAPSSTEAPH